MSKIDARLFTAGTPTLPDIERFVQLVLVEYSKDKDGRILLSAKMMHPIEVDEQIDWLVKQLEKARRSAKKLLIKRGSS